MNLNIRKARLPIAALGACALVTGGGVIAAGSAFAAGETLSFLGATSNSASIVAADPTASSSALRALTYGVRVSGLTGSSPILLQVLSAPTGGSLLSERVSGNAVPAADPTYTQVATSITAGTAAAVGATTVTLSGTPGTALSNALVRFGSSQETYIGSSSGTTLTLTTPLRSAVASGATVNSAGAASTATFQSATTTGAAVLPSYTAGDNLYLGAATAGTYTFRVFSDVNTDGAYESNTDDSTPTFTLTAKAPADAFSVTGPSSVVAGTTLAMDKVVPAVDVSDIRGGSPAALGTAIAAQLALPITDNGPTPVSATLGSGGTSTSAATFLTTTTPSWVAGDVIESTTSGSGGQYIGTVASVSGTTTTLTANAAIAVSAGGTVDNGGGVSGKASATTVVYDSTNGFYRYISANSGIYPIRQALGTPHTITGTLSFNGTAVSGGTKTTEVTTNSVSALALAAGTGQTSNVSVSGANATVRAGTGDITYTATARDNTGAVLAGKDVTFTLTAGSGSSLANLKGNGVAVPTTGSTAGQVVVTTDSNGVAALKVTSTNTADGNAYTVAASSGTASGTTINEAYQSTAATTVTADNVTAVVGGTATLTGKVVDQFGQPYTASGLTAALVVTGGATPASGSYPIDADGKFSATVTDTSGNTTPRNDTFTWTVSGHGSGTKTLAWRTSITPGAVTIDTTTIAGSSSDTAIPFVSSTTKVDIASSSAFSSDLETVKGTLKDTATTPAALPFATVTYTGSDGVYFYNSDNKLVTTMTARTTSTGKLSYDGTTDGIRVLFTKSGDATITATAGTSVTKTVTVPVELPTDPYKVVAIDVKGRPGTTFTVQGKVYDAFGNLATGRKVTLALSSISAGNFAGTDADTGNAGYQVITDDQGVWSTPFTSTANQEGEVTLTATLWNASNSAVMTTDPTANAAYATAGLTVDHGEYQDTSKITVAAPVLTLSASPHLTYGSKYYARGALLGGSGADSNATIDIYAKLPSGSFSQVDTIKADEDGKFGAAEKISKSTYFLVKMGDVSSSVVATRVYSGVILTGSSTSHDRVHLSANGGPSAEATLTFYRVMANGDKAKVGSKLSNSGGNGSITVAAPKGTRKFEVTFRAPGTTTGSDTVTVKVK